MSDRLNRLCDKSMEAICKADSLTQLLQFTLESIECSEQNEIRLCGLLGSFATLAEGLEKYLRDMDTEINDFARLVSKI